jgi:hypothetical protein
MFAMHADDELALQAVFLFLCVSSFGVDDGKLAFLDGLIASPAFQHRQQRLIIRYQPYLHERMLTCLGQRLARNADRLLASAWTIGPSQANIESTKKYPGVLKSTVRGFSRIGCREHKVFGCGEDVHLIAVSG